MQYIVILCTRCYIRIWSLNWPNCRSFPEPQVWVHKFHEPAAEGVQVSHAIADIVEWKDSCFIIQKTTSVIGIISYGEGFCPPSEMSSMQTQSS